MHPAPPSSLHLHPAPPSSIHLHPAPPSSLHLHPAPPSSFQPWLTSTHLHPADFSVHLALCNTLNVIRTKISHVMGNFTKFRPKNLKLPVLTENWHTWYLGVPDFESRLKALKFWPQNLFLGKFGPKKSKLTFLSEHWHTWYLEDADSYSDIRFLKFQT